MNRRSFFSAIAAVGSTSAAALKAAPKPLATALPIRKGDRWETFGVDWETHLGDYVESTIPYPRQGPALLIGPWRYAPTSESEYMDALESLVKEQAKGRRCVFFRPDLPDGCLESRHFSWGALPVVRRVTIFDVLSGIKITRNDVYVKFL